MSKFEINVKEKTVTSNSIKIRLTASYGDAVANADIIGMRDQYDKNTLSLDAHLDFRY